MIKEQFFPTTIYGKDVKLDNQLFANEIVEFWSNQSNCIMVDECFVAGLVIEETTNDLSEKLSGKTFVFTGSLKTISRESNKRNILAI